jgi:hypothetical protein
MISVLSAGKNGCPKTADGHGPYGTVADDGGHDERIFHGN